MSRPKFTVIIPTRERCDVLEKALRTVTAQDYEPLDILVSDNFSQDGTRDVVFGAKDPRVKYRRTDRRLAMAQNWEFALSHVADGWVAIIGDDDGLLPDSLSRVASIVRETGLRAVKSRVCNYEWPSRTGMDHGRLTIPLGAGWQVRAGHRWLARALKGYAEYGDLPMLYHGFVESSVLRQLAGTSGRVYHSSQPDIYSAVAIASVVGAYAYSFEPLAINGASKHSNGASSFSQEKQPYGSPAQIFLAEENLPFHPAVPMRRDGRFPTCIQSFVYESYLQSAFLRATDPPGSGRRHVEVIVARSGRAAEEQEWARDLVKGHGLDFETVRRNARLRKARIRLMSIPGRLDRLVNLGHVGSAASPIRDVYEASLCAAQVVQSAPSVPRLLGRWVSRAVGRAFGE